jgi:formamidopyrimidine-DNA glycosylase
MPELPEVETVRGTLERLVGGKVISGGSVSQSELRCPMPANLLQRLAGQRIQSVKRRGKFLLVGLDSRETLIVHLGMTGRIIVQTGTTTFEPGFYDRGARRFVSHDHLELRFKDGSRLFYNDSRRFGFIDLVRPGRLRFDPRMRALGPEPLSNDFSPTYLAACFAGRKTSLKAALLCQETVAGLGNIYVCEALHRARLSPRRAARTLVGGNGAPTMRLDRLIAAIRSVLQEAVAAGEQAFLRAERCEPEASPGVRFRVYDREGEPCLNAGCKGTIERSIQGGRSTFFCRRCQR